MKHYTLLVIGSVLVMVTSMLLINDAFNWSQAQNQKLEENEERNNKKNIEDMSTYEILEHINKRISGNQQEKQFAFKEFIDYINTLNYLNLLLNSKESIAESNFRYNLQGDIYNNFSLSQENLEINQASGYSSSGKKEDTNKIRKIKIDIPKGITGSQISSLLADKDLIQDKEKFINLLLKLDIDRKMRAGEFNFTSEDTAVEVLLKMIIS